MQNWEEIYKNWFTNRQWNYHDFQLNCAKKYFNKYHGLLNAPTGSGKTYALAIPVIIDYMLQKNKKKGTYLLWITPLKALAKDIANAIDDAAKELNANWYVAVRNGDTDLKERNKQKKEKPHCLVTTPESLHLLLANKNYEDFFSELHCVVIDEWHELIGSKRGVQVELAVNRLQHCIKHLRVWGISATIGNLKQAMDVLIPNKLKVVCVQSGIKKLLEVHTVYPDEIEKFPWSGHLGISMAHKIIPIINASKTCLIFTNTRGQSENWYQHLLDIAPDLAGRMAIHHGSLDMQVRNWVEEMLHNGLLKAVVCTSSLDLGVDFRPVDIVIQIGSPKGVARFLQRAGRSGHAPGEVSHIYFIPTNSLELIEAAALKQAIINEKVESRIPLENCYDVLIQYLLTLATGDGFEPEKIYNEIILTNAFKNLTRKNYDWIINFIVLGGQTLEAYDEYKKVEIIDNKICLVNRKLAMQHRLSIGTIPNTSSVRVRMLHGKNLGNIEEYFISKLNEGDAFVFSGRIVEFVKLEGVTAMVRKSEKKKAIYPSWQGGRMSLSTELSEFLRLKIDENIHSKDKELQSLIPLFEVQKQLSKIPKKDELLIEFLTSEEGNHLFVFPFEGRMVNEGMAILLAYRFSKISPITFSIAMNDYGFELSSVLDIPLQEALEEDIFSTKNLIDDLYQCNNFTEMAKRKFTDIAAISGLVYRGPAQKRVVARHMQANSALFFKVFTENEKNNLLIEQSYEEAFQQQLEEHRLREALEKIAHKKMVITYPKNPTPFCFPIMVDRLRESLSNERIEDRIARMLKGVRN